MSWRGMLQGTALKTQIDVENLLIAMGRKKKPNAMCVRMNEGREDEHQRLTKLKVISEEKIKGLRGGSGRLTKMQRTINAGGKQGRQAS